MTPELVFNVSYNHRKKALSSCILTSCIALYEIISMKLYHAYFNIKAHAITVHTFK